MACKEVLIINLWLIIPFQIRVIIALLPIVGLWKFIGKRTLWLLAIIPFLLRRVFFVLYRIIEFPLAILRENFGRAVHNIDNCVALIGEKIDFFFEKWYQYWRFNYKFRWGRILIIYFLCVICIITPSIISIENDVLKKGEEWYLLTESAILEKLVAQTKANNVQEAVIVKEEDVATDDKNEVVRIELVVAGLNSSLLVRDVPDMEAGIALDRLYNEDVVVWNGEMVFAEAENEKIEAWVKVKTQNNAEGWSRLRYLYPVDYEDVTYYINEHYCN